MRLWRWLLVAVVASVLTAGTAWAQGQKKSDQLPPRPSPEERFKRLDKDGDGCVSREEYLAGRNADQKEMYEKRFKALDTNNDGKVSLDEFKAGMLKRHRDRKPGEEKKVAEEKKAPEQKQACGEKKPDEKKPCEEKKPEQKKPEEKKQ